MNNTVVASDTSGRVFWLNMGWPASDERLVTASQAGTFGMRCARTYWTDVRANTEIRDRNPDNHIKRRGGVRA